MKLRFFSVPVLDGEEEASLLNGFLSTHRIITIEKQLVHIDAHACWAVCVSYQDLTEKPPIRKGKVDYKEVLSPAEFSIYAALRELRKSTAESEGIQVYLVFTNAQLAAMVSDRVTTVSGLQVIEGVGPAKIKKYGQTFLELLEIRIPALQLPKDQENGTPSGHPAR